MRISEIHSNVRVYGFEAQSTLPPPKSPSKSGSRVHSSGSSGVRSVVSASCFLMNPMRLCSSVKLAWCRMYPAFPPAETFDRSTLSLLYRLSFTSGFDAVAAVCSDLQSRSSSRGNLVSIASMVDQQHLRYLRRGSMTEHFWGSLLNSDGKFDSCTNFLH